MCVANHPSGPSRIRTSAARKLLTVGPIEYPDLLGPAEE
jgi:hypothetical protein